MFGFFSFLFGSILFFALFFFFSGNNHAVFDGPSFCLITVMHYSCDFHSLLTNTVDEGFLDFFQSSVLAKNRVTMESSWSYNSCRSQKPRLGMRCNEVIDSRRDLGGLGSFSLFSLFLCCSSSLREEGWWKSHLVVSTNMCKNSVNDEWAEFSAENSWEWRIHHSLGLEMAFN